MGKGEKDMQGMIQRKKIWGYDLERSATKEGSKCRLTPDGAILLCLPALPFT